MSGTEADPSTAPGQTSRSDGLLRRGLAHPITPVLSVLLLIIVVFSVTEPQNFSTSNNLRNILLDGSQFLILAVGMTFVIVTAGIDLSVGSVLVFASVVSAKAMVNYGGDGWGTVVLGLLVAVVAGAAWGALNGFLIAKAKLSPLIVTLATTGVALGFAQIITNGTDLAGVPPKLSVTIGTGRLWGVPYVSLLAIVVVIIGAVILQRTRFGRYTFAVGSNAEAARRAGVNVDLHLVKVYLLMGALAGLAAMVDLARFSTTAQQGHNADNLSAIAAVVLGGTSLFGGAGSMIGTAIGVFIPAVLQNGFVIWGIQTYWQQVAVGIVLIGAVYFDRVRRTRRK